MLTSCRSWYNVTASMHANLESCQFALQRAARRMAFNKHCRTQHGQLKVVANVHHLPEGPVGGLQPFALPLCALEDRRRRQRDVQSERDGDQELQPRDLVHPPGLAPPPGLLTCDDFEMRLSDDSQPYAWKCRQTCYRA